MLLSFGKSCEISNVLHGTKYYTHTNFIRFLYGYICGISDILWHLVELLWSPLEKQTNYLVCCVCSFVVVLLLWFPLEEQAVYLEQISFLLAFCLFVVVLPLWFPLE